MAKRQKRSEIVPEENTGEYTVRIENFGPIELAEIPFKPGRITVAYGSNGAGKSESQIAVDALAGLKEAKEKVTLRDGAESGQISGFGRKLNLTASRCTTTGEINVEVVEEGFSLARFVNPKFKDSEANDRQRLKDLASVLGIEIDREAVYRLVGGREKARAELEAEAQGGGLPGEELDRRFREIKRQERAVYNAIVSEKTSKAKDPAEYVAALKADCDRVALDQEKSATALTGEADGIESTLPEIPADAITDAEVLSAAVADAVQAKRDLERRDQSAADAERLATQAEAILKAGQGQTVEDAGKILDAATLEVAESETLIRETEAALARERVRLDGLKRRQADAQKAKEDAIERQTELAAARVALQEKIQRPKPEEWTQAEAKIQAAELAMTNGAKYREAAETRARIASLRQEAAEAVEEAEGLRAAAKATVGLLVEPINALNCGIEIDDNMRLILTEHPVRGRCPVEDLSPGEAWALVIRLLVGVVGHDMPAFVSIPQEALEGLDPINLKMFVEEVAKTQLMVFVAKATATESPDGELTRDNVFAKLVDHWKDLRR